MNKYTENPKYIPNPTGERIGSAEEKIRAKEKHVELDREIKNMKDIAHRLEGLLSKVSGEGGNPQSDDSCKNPEPSLLYVLNNGAVELRFTRDTCHDLITQIENYLF